MILQGSKWEVNGKLYEVTDTYREWVYGRRNGEIRKFRREYWMEKGVRL